MNEIVINRRVLQRLNQIRSTLSYIFQFKSLFFIINFFAVYSAHAVNQNTNINPVVNINQLHKPVIMGYYSQWSIYSPNQHIQDIPLHFMTHFVYKSAFLSAEGNVEPGDIFSDIEHLYPDANIEIDTVLGSFGQLIKLKKKHPDLQSIISIGGWGRSQNFSTLSMTEKGRKQIASSAIKFMRMYKFDGIEIDWQFPIKPMASSRKGLVTHQPKDAENLNLLLVEIKRQLALLSEKYWLQVILAPYSLDDQWQASLINNSVDLVVLDVSRIYGDKEMISDHLAPLYAQPGRKSIDQLIKKLNRFGIDNEKIVVSIPSFAIGWEGVSGNNRGLQQDASNVSWGSWDGQGSGSTGLYTRKSLSFILSLGSYPQYWDELGKSSYLYNKNKFNGHFIAFESDRSIAEKVNYATTNKLAGIAINQLHNGTYVLETTFSNYHILQGWYYRSVAFWQLNRHVLLPVVQFIVIILIAFIGTIRFLNFRNTMRLKEQKQFQLLQRNLQTLEWPLLNLFKIAPELVKRNLLDQASAEQLINASSQLLKPISHIISETELNRSPSPQTHELVDLQELLSSTVSLAHISKKYHIDCDSTIKCQFFTDQNHFQQFFYNLCLFCFESSNSRRSLFIKVVTTNHALCLELNATDGIDTNIMNHTQLKSLLNQAKTLGLQLKIAENPNTALQLLIPINQCILGEVKPQKLVFNTKLDESISDKLTQKLKEKTISSTLYDNDGSKKPLANVKKSEVVNFTEDNVLLDNIALFNLSTIPSKDIFKGLEHACQFFLNHLEQDTKITIYQHDHVVSKFGEESLSSNHGTLINADEFSIEIITDNVLSNEDEQLIQVLISQTQMVQKALKSLIKEPSMLAELHELTRYKEGIQYLKAESGYTGLYLQGKKDPRYITMRLRTIKLYFDDTAFIQIHRSYLVNPKKVSHVESVSKLKFELVIGDNKLPISRSYITLLRTTYPQWFSLKN
jgi:chitinase